MQWQCGVFVFVSEVHEVSLCCALVLLLLLNKQASDQASGQAAGTVVCLLAWLLDFDLSVFGFLVVLARNWSNSKAPHYTMLLP
jgi:hypothetical protein